MIDVTKVEKNPLPDIVKVLNSAHDISMWLPFIDAAVAIGFQMKLSGVEFSTDDDIARIMIELVSIGLLKINPKDRTQIALADSYRTRNRGLHDTN
jgi:hypothetical protein